MSLLLKYLSYLRRRDDPKARFDFLRQVAARVYPEYRFKWPQLDWWQAADFDAYLERDLGQCNPVFARGHFVEHDRLAKIHIDLAHRFVEAAQIAEEPA